MVFLLTALGDIVSARVFCMELNFLCFLDVV